MNLTKIIDESVQAVLTEKKDVGAYEPGPNVGPGKSPSEYVPAGGEQESNATRILRKVKEGAEGVGKKVVGAIKSEPVAASTAAAIAAGLGAVALAKKLRKAKKSAKAKA